MNRKDISNIGYIASLWFAMIVLLYAVCSVLGIMTNKPVVPDFLTFMIYIFAGFGGVGVALLITGTIYGISVGLSRIFKKIWKVK